MRRNPLFMDRDRERDWLAPRRPWPGFWPTLLMLAYQFAGTEGAASTAMALWCLWFFIKALLWATP